MTAATHVAEAGLKLGWLLPGVQYVLSGGALADAGAYALLMEVTLDLGTGKARQRQVADVRHEFPTVPAALLGARPSHRVNNIHNT